jgi:peptidyl-prolyl cis-trans isomerase C
MNRPTSICLRALILMFALRPSGAGAVEEPAQAPGDSSLTNPVLARVNGVEIHASQVEARMGLALRKASGLQGELDADKLGALRHGFLEGLVNEELLYQDSVRQKIDVAEKAVEEQARVLESHFPSGEEFVASLREEGMTPATLRQAIRRNLAIGELIKQKVNRGVSVSETEISEYYRKNRDKLRRPEAAHVLEIFARVDSRADAVAKGKVRQAMEGILEEIRNGKDFKELMGEFSEGRESSRGGDLGWLTRNGDRPLIAEAAMKLKPGEISDILETPAGLHIIKVVGRKPAEEVSLQESKSQIATILRQEKEQSALKEYVAALKSGAKIEILTPTP